MDELAGLIGGLVAIIAVIYAAVWLISILVVVAIGLTLVAGPPLGLGTILKRMLTRRYALSNRKKWQCAGAAVLAFAIPFLALLVETPMANWEDWEVWGAMTWAGTVLSMSSIAIFLALSAYQQHFAEHRRAIYRADEIFGEKRYRHVETIRRVEQLDRDLDRAERKHGRLLQAQASLNMQMETLIENNDPALCRIKIGHWEGQYSSLPPRRVENELKVVSRELSAVRRAPPATLKLQSMFLERQMLRQKLARHHVAARFDELKAERDSLRVEAASYAETMNECKRVQSERAAKIAQLKNQRLVIQ